jgi:hypothetical protein
MSITKLSTVFDVFEDESQAIDSFKILEGVALPTAPHNDPSTIAVLNRS